MTPIKCRLNHSAGFPDQNDWQDGFVLKFVGTNQGVKAIGVRASGRGDPEVYELTRVQIDTFALSATESSAE